MPSIEFRSTALAFFTILLSFSAAYAEEGWNPDIKFPALSPEDAIKTFEIPEGYRLECVASEPMVQEPVSFAYDGNGALYVCEWLTYMQDEFGTKQLEPVSRVVKLVDTDGDGKMDKRTVFIDKVILPRAVLPIHDRVYVTFTQSKSVWSFFDDDGDGVADRKERAYYRTGQHGNIEHQHSGMVWNLDNTVCTNDHRFRYEGGKLISQKHSMWRISQWGMARDDDGRLVGTWAGRGNPAHSFQLPAGYPIVSVPEHGPDFSTPYAICRVWDQSTGGYKTKEQAVLRHFSAPCGQTVLRSPLMPEFYGRVVTCEPVGRFLRMSTIRWKDGMGVAENSFPKSEFIRSSDAYFRPIWTGNAPDGTFVFADMYRGIIQEKDYFPTDPSDSRKSWVARYHRVKKWGMVEVIRKGRIYRLVPIGKKPGPQPRMLDESSTELVRHLANPNGWWRDSAQKLIVCRGDKSAVPALRTMAHGNSDANARIHALWSLKGLDSLSKETILANVSHANARVRRAAVQLAEPYLVAGDEEISSALWEMHGDENAHVGIQLYLAYNATGFGVPETITTRKSPVLDALRARQAEIDRQKNALSSSAKTGEALFASNCAKCHGGDGKGVKQGPQYLAPSFVDSYWFKHGGKAGILARIVLKGEIGSIDGVTYGQGMMLPLEKELNDQQIADVLNYIGERWHRWGKPIPASKIGSVRRQFADRKTPFAHSNLRELARKGGGR
ncbi:MAG: c-type cytochrome [Planctomycetota bacterium]